MQAPKQGRKLHLQHPVESEVTSSQVA